jgi:hypothetical protein
MNRAHQEALFQTTNQGLLSIRQSEINYYQSVNVAFGTQAALVGGFTYGVFTQGQINYLNGYDGIQIVADLYWFFSATTIAVAVHIIMCTMLIQVVGPGLALNGPVGSMARATEGMRVEQKHIMTAFILMMISFALATIMAFWMCMNTEAAIAGTIAYLIAMRYWYVYCERIYLRFYWKVEESGWHPNAQNDEAFEDDDPFEKPSNAENDRQSLWKKPKTKRLRKGILGYVFGSRTQLDEETHGQVAQPNDMTPDNNGSPQSSADTSGLNFNPLGGLAVNSTWAATSLGRGIVMEGYLTKRGGSTQKFIDFGHEPWERRYFTLSSTACLFMYKSRHDYRTDVKSTIYTRPLRLGDFYIEVSNGDHAERNGDKQMETYSQASSSFSETAAYKALASINSLIVPQDEEIKPDRFQMTLVPRENGERQSERTALGATASSSVSNPLHAEPPSPRAQAQRGIRDHWVLRCDTEEELQQWVSVMRELCPSCFNVDNV